MRNEDVPTQLEALHDLLHAACAMGDGDLRLSDLGFWPSGRLADVTCDIRNREKAEAREEIRRLLAAGVAEDVVAPAALKAMEVPNHDTEHHPGRVDS